MRELLNMKGSLIFAIKRAMITDTECPEKVDIQLLDLYDESDEKGKEIIDTVLTIITGYELITLIRNANGDD